MRPGTDACPIGTRGAAVAGLASRQYRVPCLSARRRRGEATRAALGLPLVGAVSACRAPRDATAAGGATNNNKLSSRETLRRGRHRRRRGVAVARRRVASSDGAGCPLARSIIFGPALPPCGIVWLPDGVGQWQGGVGGFFVCVGSLFRSLVCTIFFRIWASRWNLCGTPVDVVLACVRSGMRVGSVFEI